MASFKVDTAVKPRRTPSMYETVTLAALAVGYTFDSDSFQSLIPNPPIAGQNGAITWVQLANSYWVPMVYKGVTYVEQVTVTPPTGTKQFTLSVEGFVPFTGTLTPQS